MGNKSALSEDVEARLEMAAVLTQQQLSYARGIVSSAGITSPEITAAVVHALAINYAAQGVGSSTAKRGGKKAAAATVPDSQFDLLMPDPFDPQTR